MMLKFYLFSIVFVFPYEQLVAATNNFKAANFLGEGRYGKVYKGKFEDSDKIVAIKKLDPDGDQRLREFVIEVLTVGVADHPNPVKLIGFCGQEEQRILVYEYMSLRYLEDHLHDQELYAYQETFCGTGYLSFSKSRRTKSRLGFSVSSRTKTKHLLVM